MKRLSTRGCISRGINMKIFLTTLKVPAPKVCSTCITSWCFCSRNVNSWKCLESYSKIVGIRWAVITWTPIRKLKGKMLFLCFKYFCPKSSLSCKTSTKLDAPHLVAIRFPPSRTPSRSVFFFIILGVQWSLGHIYLEFPFLNMVYDP
jgi:hypothetical protein